MNTFSTGCKAAVLTLVVGLMVLVMPAAADDRTDAILTGIYLTEQEQVKLTEAGMEIFSPSSCEHLLAVLGASEWRVVDQAAFSFDPSAGFGTLWAILKRDDEALFFTARGGDYCNATLNQVSKQAVSASGVETFEEEAFQYTPFCTVSTSSFYEETLDEEFTAVMIFLLYELPDGMSLFTTIDVPLEVGEFGLWELDEDSTVQINTSGRLFPNELKSLEPDGVETRYYPDLDNWDYENPLGTVVVDSLEPFTGSFELNEYVNDAGESQQFRFGFACDDVVGDEASFELDG